MERIHTNIYNLKMYSFFYFIYDSITRVTRQTVSNMKNRAHQYLHEGGQLLSFSMKNFQLNVESGSSVDSFFDR